MEEDRRLYLHSISLSLTSLEQHLSSGQYSTVRIVAQDSYVDVLCRITGLQSSLPSCYASKTNKNKLARTHAMLLSSPSTHDCLHISSSASRLNVKEHGPNCNQLLRIPSCLIVSESQVAFDIVATYEIQANILPQISNPTVFDSRPKTGRM